MRTTARLTAVLAVLAAIPSPAAAAPAIEIFKVSAASIPGVPGTGDRLGAGALIRGTLKISGTEYGGSPPPLIGVEFFAPSGVRLHPQGFATCSAATLELRGPGACPRRSIAGPRGSVLGAVSFGGDRVPERASVQPFFAPGGGMEVFVDGRSPALVEILAHGHVVPAAPPFGLRLIGEIPLIVTLPGALDASFIEGTVGLGAGYRQGARTVSYVTLPRRCPRSGWAVKARLAFLGGAEVSASGKMPCPPR